MRKTITISILCLLFVACNGDQDGADAYGNFEAQEVMISAEVQGRILSFGYEEGDALATGREIALVDTLPLSLKLRQMESGRSSLDARIRTLNAQVAAQNVQLRVLEKERKRITQMVEGGAATTKQKDDVEGQIEILTAQIEATESQKIPVRSERQTLEIKIMQLQDQLDRCRVKSPMDGVLLSKFKEEGEIVAPGQALFKMADMSELILRAYVSGEQLSQARTGAEVTVGYDSPEGIKEVRGTIRWISSRAEFTPKIIQTRQERVNLVYAVKVAVPNDGSLRIGMPGELKFR
jgi:HlyD family secretion protein